MFFQTFRLISRLFSIISLFFVFSAQAGILKLIDSSYSRPGSSGVMRLHGAQGVASAPNGNILVADTMHDFIIEISKEGQRSIIVGCVDGDCDKDSEDPKKIKLSNPQAVAYSPEGSIIIADTYNNRILELNGTQISRIAGSRLSKKANNQDIIVDAPNFTNLLMPNSLAVKRDGRIVIGDTGRILELSKDRQKIYPLSGSPYYANGTKQEKLYPADAPVVHPADLAIDDNDNLSVVENHLYNNCVYKISNTLKFSQFNLDFKPIGIAVHPGGNHIILLSENRTFLFNAKGSFLEITNLSASGQSHSISARHAAFATDGEIIISMGHSIASLKVDAN